VRNTRAGVALSVVCGLYLAAYGALSWGRPHDASAERHLVERHSDAGAGGAGQRGARPVDDVVSLV